MTNRREFLATLTMAAGAVTVLRPLNGWAGLGQATTFPSQSCKLIILHTANLEGQLGKLGLHEPFSELGGLQNISHAVDAIRKETLPVLLLDAGNMRSDLGLKEEERLQFYQALARLQYDAVLPGSTDLVNGPSQFYKLAERSKLAALGQGSKGLCSTVVKKGSVQVGIIAIKASALQLRSSSFTSSLNAMAAGLKEKGCTLTIALAQGSLATCAQLAARSSRIDVVASSAENNSMYNTRIIRNRIGQEVILSSAGAKGVMLSRIDISINGKGEKTGMASAAVFAGGTDLAASDILKKYSALHC